MSPDEPPDEPLLAYICGADANKDQETRRVLFRISRLAEQHQCTVIPMRHLNIGSAMRPRSRQLLDRDVGEVGQLIVVGQKHVTTGLDRRGEMKRVGQPVPLRLSGRDGGVGVATPDSAGPDVHRGSQAQRP